MNRRSFLTGLMASAAVAPMLKGLTWQEQWRELASYIQPRLTVYNGIPIRKVHTIIYGNAEVMPMEFTRFTPRWSGPDENRS